ncbi:MAG: diguanylate cyclase, partial [Pseudomonadota bacterium]
HVSDATALQRQLRGLLRQALSGCRGWKPEVDEEIEVLLVHVDRADDVADLDTLDTVMTKVTGMIRDQRIRLEATSAVAVAQLDQALYETAAAAREIKALDDAVAALLAKPEANAEEKFIALGTLLIEHIRTLTRERDEAIVFLEQVQDSLRHFELWTADAVTSADAQREASSALERQVQDDVDAFATSLDGTTDNQELKARMLKQLEQVGRRISDYREKEEGRLQEVEARNDALTDELNGLRVQTAALQNTLKEQESLLLLDTLTGVNSRFSYEQRIVELLAGAQRHGQPFCFALWDIDHFKSINDSLGHQGGDAILRQVAGHLDRYTRKTDFVARLGGEEFVVLLPDTLGDDAMQLADKLRALIGAAKLQYDGEAHHVSISCGITQSLENDSVESIYKRADEALYEAKRAGRDRCIAA